MKVRWRILKSNGERCETVTEEGVIPAHGDGKWINGKLKIGTEAVVIVRGLVSIEEDCLVIAKEVTNNSKEEPICNLDEWLEKMISANDSKGEIPEC